MQADNPFRLDKYLARRDFNEAARGYEDAAVLQRSVSDRLIERLDLISLKPRYVLDLGSGPGISSRNLARRFLRSRIIQADFAVNMLRSARGRNRPFFSRQSYLCADAERLPLSEGRIDLVFSNLMLQWCMDPQQIFVEISRVLRPGGLIIFSSFGPDTLRELRESWKSADDGVHVNAFIDMHDLGDALMQCGFENPVMETEYFVLTYKDVFGLMRDLKQLGANNVNSGRRRSLTGKGRMEKMIDAYEKSRRAGKLPATYEVIYGHAWKRSSSGSVETDGPPPVMIPVSSIGRRRS